MRKIGDNDWIADMQCKRCGCAWFEGHYMPKKNLFLAIVLTASLVYCPNCGASSPDDLKTISTRYGGWE